MITNLSSGRVFVMSFSFKAKCPVCGWKLPIIGKEYRKRQPFSCPDCNSQLLYYSPFYFLSIFFPVFLVPFAIWINTLDDNILLQLMIAGGLFLMVPLIYATEKLKLQNQKSDIS